MVFLNGSLLNKQRRSTECSKELIIPYNVESRRYRCTLTNINHDGVSEQHLLQGQKMESARVIIKICKEV